MSAPEFAPDEILRVLAMHGVVCVVIGGFAAYVQGSRLPTDDIDIVPRTDAENFARLSAALYELDAKVRAGDETFPFSHDGTSLAASTILNLQTKFGNLDVTQCPSGTAGYEDLRREARQAEIGGVSVVLASLSDIVRSKEAAGRDKDRRALPLLRELVASQLRDRRPPKR
jgi:hypothetical protein